MDFSRTLLEAASPGADKQRKASINAGQVMQEKGRAEMR
jgi:hypothetical protein